MDSSWNAFFDEVHDQPWGKELSIKIKKAYSQETCYPPMKMMFNAFDRCPMDKIKVVIIGQDPYCNPGQAMGLSFSVPAGVPLPPSLRNIYKEIEDEGLGMMNTADGDLTHWADQGVLLLNAYLSVRQGQPGSHQWPEYDEFTKLALSYISKLEQPIVFLFWGSFAKRFAGFATNPKHLKLFANHPSPLSANRGGWFGCGHFKAANEYLISQGVTPIDWCNGMLKL